MAEINTINTNEGYANVTSGNVQLSGVTPPKFNPSDIKKTEIAKTEEATEPEFSAKLYDQNNVKKGMINDKTSVEDVINTNLYGTTRDPGKNGQFVYDTMTGLDNDYMKVDGKKGAPSIFNNYTIFTHHACNELNDFYDVKGENGIFSHEVDKKELTLQHLLTKYSPDTQTVRPYYANDFLYAKYYNKIPLNRLITLRRYPFPTYDNLEFADENFGEGEGKVNHRYRPLAQAITYFGDPTDNSLSSLLSIKGKIAWKNVSAQIWDEESQPNKGNDVEKGIFGGFTGTNFSGKSTFTSNINNVTSGAASTTNNVSNNFFNITKYASNNNDLSGRRSASVDAARKKTDFQYTHKVFGPINVVKDTMTRDTGIGADLTFSLTFDYQLKSYNFINPKIAMLDLLGNMLALTFYHAKWWGGANRFFPKTMDQYGMLGDQKAFYEGRYGDYFKSVGDTFTKAGNGIMTGMQNIWNNLISGNFSAIASMLMGGATKLLDIRSRKSRPNVISVRSLVSGAPVGEYHLTIGNPDNPIATVGNLILSDFEIVWGEQLGFDDFPDSVKLKVNLKKARPMDSGDIQSIFNYGQGRTYVPEAGAVDVINAIADAADFFKDSRTRVKNGMALTQSFGVVN